MQKVLSVENLVKEFGRGDRITRAVDGISFDLYEGEILGFLGPNGAGKTTTIQMLLSTLSPTSGTIRYLGKDLMLHRSEILQKVSFASSYTKLPWRLTVAENLDIYGRLYGLSKKERCARAEKLLKYFGVWRLREKVLAGLSAGEMTRIMLTKAFLAYPRVCLLDEPTASLDPEIAQEVRAFVKAQRRDFGVAILFTSHNMEEVVDVCDRVIFLKQGKIVACDEPRRLAERSALSRVSITVSCGVQVLEGLLREQNIQYELSQSSAVMAMPHQQTGPFISLLGARGVVCSEISIKPPTLEEYFLQVAKEAA